MKDMPEIKRIVIIAGEESGDLHAARIVDELKLNHPQWHFSGIGGRHMENAGVHLISNLAQFGVTGISEVLRHFLVIRRAFKDIQAHLKAYKPDLLILVDYPGFNLRLATFAKKELGIRTLYYISPQIWAWKAGRINTIRDCIDHMAVILPFEKKLYQDGGVPVSFVGHPLVEHQITEPFHLIDTRKKLGLPENKRLIAMLPGSRLHEIERHMPVLKSSAELLCQQFSDLHFVIPVAGTIDPLLIDAYFKDSPVPYTLTHGKAIEAVSCCDCAVVASGTASLECALLEKPMCIIYKASVITYMAALKFMKVKYLGLCNLLQNEMIVPELLQYDCNPTEMTRMVTSLLETPDVIERMQTRLAQLKLSLSSHNADCSILDLIESEIMHEKSTI